MNERTSPVAKIALALIGFVFIGIAFAIFVYVFGNHAGLNHGSGQQSVQTAGGPGANQDADPKLAKVNAYISFNNGIIKWQHFGSDIEDFRTRNADMLKGSPGAASFSAPNPVDATQVEALRKAVNMPASVPELDPQAKAMLDAVTALQPTEQALSDYANSRGYLADNGAKARQLAPTLIAQLGAAATAENGLSHAIELWGFKSDEADLAKSDKSSPHYLLLNDTLAARKILDAVRYADSAGQAARQIDALLPQMVAANDAVGSLSASAANSARDPGCRRFKSQMEMFIGNARILSLDLKRPPQPSSDPDWVVRMKITGAGHSGMASESDPPSVARAALFGSYNMSVDNPTMCSP